MRHIYITALSLMVMLAASTVEAARSQIEIVGSSTVYPFASLAAEKFGKITDFSTPKIESTGTGGGMKLFCAGVSEKYPDFVNASRRMKKSEFDKCKKNGIGDILEIKLGYDGIVIAQSKQAKRMDLTNKDLYLALAKYIPNDKGKLIKNPYKTWADVNPNLPNIKIETLGPPPTSGTRDAFLELVMEDGAKHFSMLKTLSTLGGKSEDGKKILAILKKAGLSIKYYENLAYQGHAAKAGKKLFKRIVHGIREDGVYIEIGENDNLVIQKLLRNKNSVGIFGFSFLDQNRHIVRGIKINGVRPEFSSIADGSYPVARPLFIYVKTDHIGTIPGMTRFMNELTSNRASGSEGYLTNIGLIPALSNERAKIRSIIKHKTPLSL